MSTCIKTGGLIVLEDYDEAFSCDLHLVRLAGQPVALVAHTAGPGMPRFPEYAVEVRVPAGADYFLRKNVTGYGIIVVAPESCIPEQRLLDYIKEDPLTWRLQWGRR